MNMLLKQKQKNNNHAVAFPDLSLSEHLLQLSLFALKTFTKKNRIPKVKSCFSLLEFRLCSGKITVRFIRN